MEHVAADRPLRLKALDAADLEILSAHLQDAVVPVCEMAYLRAESRFILVATRYRWEHVEDSDIDVPGERVCCGLAFNGVRRVRCRGVDPRQRGTVLNLLAIQPGDGMVDLVFSGGGVIRLEVDGVDCRMEDITEPWPTSFKPCHGLDDAEADKAAN